MTYLLIINTILFVTLVVVDVRSGNTFVRSGTACALVGAWALATSASWVIWAGVKVWGMV